MHHGLACRHATALTSVLPERIIECASLFEQMFRTFSGKLLKFKWQLSERFELLDIFLRRRTLSINQNHNEILEILQHLEKSANVFHFFQQMNAGILQKTLQLRNLGGTAIY